MAVTWKCVVTNLRYENQGTLTRYANLKCSPRLGSTPTLTVDVKPEDRLYGFLRDDDALLKLYRIEDDRSDLVFHGGMVASDEQADVSGSLSLSVSAAGPSYRLAHAQTFNAPFLMTDDNGSSFLTHSLLGTKTRENLLNTIALYLSDRVGEPASTSPPYTVARPGWSFAPTGTLQVKFSRPTTGVGAGSSLTITSVDNYAMLSDLWADAAGGVNGVDWYVEPVEGYQDSFIQVPTSGPAYAMVYGVIGQLRVESIIGRERGNSIFEYGFGKHNVSAFSRQRSWETLATSTFASSGTTATTSNKPTTVDPGGGRYQHGGNWDAAVSVSGLPDNSTLISDLLAEHVAVRSHPRQVYTLTSTPHSPQYLIDYDLGDQVPFRAKRDDEALFEGLVRVYGVDIEIDAAGVGTQKPLTVYSES